jgi:hypothetical protein
MNRILNLKRMVNSVMNVRIVAITIVLVIVTCVVVTFLWRKEQWKEKKKVEIMEKSRKREETLRQDIARQRKSPVHVRPKFFKENGLMDARFAKTDTPEKEMRETFVYLIEEFMKYSDKIGIKPILIGEALIGYYFSGDLLPWGNDVTFALVEPSISKLHAYDGNNWFLEINPNSSYHGSDDTNNTISARVISKNNGVFLNINFLRQEGDKMIGKCRTHTCRAVMLLPQSGENGLRLRGLGDNGVWIPENVKNLIDNTRYGKIGSIPINEIGNKFGYGFDSRTRSWYKIG